MAPPTDSDSLTLLVDRDLYFVTQLKVTDEPPKHLVDYLTGVSKTDKTIAISRTAVEVSILGHTSLDPSIPAEWNCIRIAGPMEFELTGVIASFTAPLKEAGCPVFVTSTWNTDFILIPKDKIDIAVDALKADGWKFKE